MDKNAHSLGNRADYGGDGHPAGPAGRLDDWMVRNIMRFAGSPRILTRLWDGRELYFADEAPVATMEFLDRRTLLAVVLRKQLGFGDGYSTGRIRVHGDLLAFNEELARTTSRTGSYRGDWLRSRLAGLRVNSLARASDNIHHHYDLGNDFYSLWLDERMVYTCAYYERDGATLEQAQVAKLEHVCRKLQLQPGQRVVEAGCGWGSLALHMARHYGVEVTAYNILSPQIAWAREQARVQGLADRVAFINEDYRKITGQYDVFVSVGMLEHVGLRRYRQLGDLIHACLKPTGRGLIHSIGRSHSAAIDPWITKRIFPGSYVPGLGDMAAIFEPHRFSVLDVENLRLHYARTCRDWLENYRRVEDQVHDMYDEEFVRVWRLYLAGATAAFSHGTMQLYQVLFAPDGNNALPLTRRHQYLAH
jgi:cyclopropane-fatty-acyl-phospholipid synthase